jgi:hypothetical protein
MKMKFLLLSLTFFFIAMGQSQGASPGFSPQTIKQLYKEGEFEKIRIQLETFLKRSDATASRDERILAYKYLGVVYASQPDGAPQAEAYFFRLLDLSPNVQLTELYVSSTVNGIFEKTQQRFIKERQSSSSVDEFGHPIGHADPGDQGNAMTRAASKNPGGETLADSRQPMRNEPRQNLRSDEKGVKIWPWVLGAAVVGGGISLYVMSSNDNSNKKETVIPGTPEN